MGPPGYDQPGRLPGQNRLDPAFLMFLLVLGHPKDGLMAKGPKLAVDPLQDLGENLVSKFGNTDADKG